MTNTLADRCELLRAAWAWWASTLDDLDDAQWTATTRLEGWDVAALAGHHSMFVQILGAVLSRQLDPGTPAEIASARDMLRRFNAPGGIAGASAGTVAEMARRQAQNLSRADLVQLFAVDGPDVIADVERTGPVAVDYLGNGTLPIAEAVSIGIMESVVHGLDLCAAAGVPGELPEPAVTHTVELLASLADPVDFIDAATGRRAAAVLPVLR